MSYIKSGVQPSVAQEIGAGLRAHRSGDLESALSCYQRALLVQPQNPDALNLMGVALQQSGRPLEALDHLQRAAQLRRNDPGIWANLAQAHAALDQHADAAEAFRKASRIEPRQPDYQMGLANALAQQGRFKDAETLYEKLTHRHPDQPLLWFNRGNVLRDQGRAADAVESYRRALALQPDFIDARNNLGGALHAQLQFDAAEREYRACITAQPGYLLAHLSLASLLIDVARDAEAEAACREILRQDPDCIDAWLMQALAQRHQGRVNAQLETTAAAVARMPANARIVKVRAGALFDAGHFAEAVRELDREQTLEPDEKVRQDVLAGALLAYGYIEAAWICYRGRPGPQIFRSKNPGVMLSDTLPDRVEGARVFVHREQGLGDELFFLRYAPLLAQHGARITYRAGSKIRSLLERVPCLGSVIEEQAPIPDADVIMLVGDLPHALTPAAIARQQLADACALQPGQSLSFSKSLRERYPASLSIAALPERIEDIRKRLADAGPAPYLGITWRAGIPPREQGAGNWSLHKFAALTDFARAVSAFPGTLLSLQRAPAAGETAAFAEASGRPVHDFSDLNDDLEGMLALLALIDEYVGVSNTNMHLRAAAGKTARVLVPAPAEWRWGVRGAESPWFPGFRIYRQDDDGNWTQAWSEFGRDLARAWPA